MSRFAEQEEYAYHEQAREDYISELAAEHRDPYAYCGIEEDNDMTEIYLNNSKLPAVSRELTEDELSRVALKFAGDDAEQAMALVALANALEVGEELLLSGAYYLTRGRNCSLAQVEDLAADCDGTGWDGGEFETRAGGAP